MTDPDPAYAPASQPMVGTTGSLPAADMMTAQESDQTGDVPGVGPASAAEVSPGPAETIEAQGIGPRTPYPEGNPPPPAETITYSQGVKGVTDKPAVQPASTREPIR